MTDNFFKTLNDMPVQDRLHALCTKANEEHIPGNLLVMGYRLTRHGDPDFADKFWQAVKTGGDLDNAFARFAEWAIMCLESAFGKQDITVRLRRNYENGDEYLVMEDATHAFTAAHMGIGEYGEGRDKAYRHLQNGLVRAIIDLERIRVFTYECDSQPSNEQA